MLQPLWAPQATLPAVYHSFMTSVSSEDNPPQQYLSWDSQLSLLRSGTKGWRRHYSCSSATDCAPQHDSLHYLLLRVSYWMEQIISKVFSKKLSSFLNSEWINGAKGLQTFCQCSYLKAILSFPDCFEDTEPASDCAEPVQWTNTWSSGRLCIWWLIHGYKSHHYIVLFLSKFLDLLFKNDHRFQK